MLAMNMKRGNFKRNESSFLFISLLVAGKADFCLWKRECHEISLFETLLDALLEKH
jgi:hypothetical protein